MNKPHCYRSLISPIRDRKPRPRWSVMIPTYNCANYLRETLASVLEQDPGADVMQIEVVDDCSTQDNPAAVVEELGKGRVGFYQQPQNVGYIRNFETCLQRSRGRLVHLLHGDDFVKDGFYRQMELAFDKNPDLGAAFCRHIAVDERGDRIWISDLEQSETGIFIPGIERLAVKQRIQTPSIVVPRHIYEHLGGFDRRFSCCGEDWEMWVRIASKYPIWYETEPLAVYRIHSQSISRLSTRTGADIRDLRMAIEIVKPYLPAQIADRISRQAKEHWALFSLRHLAPKMLAMGDRRGALNQMIEALKCSRSLEVIKGVSKMSIKLLNPL
jgi:GT2 family glycosyltransferase